MAMGWLTIKDEVQLLLEVHQVSRVYPRFTGLVASVAML